MPRIAGTWFDPADLPDAAEQAALEAEARAMGAPTCGGTACVDAAPDHAIGDPGCVAYEPSEEDPF